MNYAAMLVLVGLACLALLLLAVHILFRVPRRVEQGSPADHGIDYEEVHLRAVDGKRLFAWWLPAEDAAPAIVVLHGWGGNAEYMLPLALPLHKAGLNILLLDARNHGRSEAAAFSSLPRFAEDAGVAVDWVKATSRDPGRRVALLGHSVGAGAVLLEASRRNDISALISIAAFAHPAWMMRRYLDRFRIPGFLQTGINRYVEWVIGYRFDDIAPRNTVCRIRCPVLLVHGTADRTVPIGDAEAIRDRCRHNPPELLRIEGGDHDSVDRIEHNADRLIAFLKNAGFIDAASGRSRDQDGRSSR